MIRSYPISYPSTGGPGRDRPGRDRPGRDRPGRGLRQLTQGVADYLRAHEKMAPLLPALTRMAALQKDCSALLPTIFESSAVRQYESGQLVLGVANPALASRLKQQLPKLQEWLQKRGWQVDAIRVKLQLPAALPQEREVRSVDLPPGALAAWAELKSSLEDTPRNAALKAAIEAMLSRRSRAR